MCIHFCIIFIVIFKLACILHETVCNHEELQLFIGRIGNHIIYHLRQFSFCLINETKYFSTVSLCFLHTFNHLNRASCNRRQNHNCAFADTLVACCHILSCILWEKFNSRFLLHMHFSLQSRSPCTANAKPADILVSFSTNSINNFFNTTAKSQSTIDAVQLLLFIKFQHNLYLHFLNTVKKLTYFIIHQLSLCCKLFHQKIISDHP